MAPGTLKVWQDGQVWHVIWMIKEIPASGEDFDKIKDRLRAELLAVESQSRLYDLLADLWEQAAVVVNLSPDPAAAPAAGGRRGRLRQRASRSAAPTCPAHWCGSSARRRCPAAIERTLILQEAVRRGVSVQPPGGRGADEGHRRAALRRPGRARGLSAEDLQKLVSESTETTQAVKARLAREMVDPDDVRATILAEKLVAPDIKVTDQEIQDAYNAYGGERYVVRDLPTDTRAQAQSVLRPPGAGGQLRAAGPHGVLRARRLDGGRGAARGRGRQPLV